MLVFARRGKLEAEPADPAVMLEGLREICAYTLGPGIRMQVDCPPDLPHLLADKGQLETALVNLATNARDAMLAGGTLTLSAAAETVTPGDDDQAGHPAGLTPGAYLRLSVSDTGSGMDGLVLARVAEPFFTTKGIGEGTGLGLSMVKGFAEQAGGGFAVTSEPGIGTVASLWLPQAGVAEPAGIKASDQDRAPAAGSRVLLVDDDHLVRETLAAQLEAEGHFVLSASGGDDALALLETTAAVDVLVTDLAMMGMNGLLLIQRAQTLRPRLPAILLTGYVEDAAALQPGEQDKVSYILMHKPVSGAQLAGRIAMVPVAMAGDPQLPETRVAVTLGA
jgi:CheY-like chemotaxis protein